MGLFTLKRGDPTRPWVHAAAAGARQIADNRPAHRARRRIHTKPGHACCALCSAGPPSRRSRNNTTYAIRAHWQTPKLAMPPLAYGPLSPRTAGWTDTARVHRVPPSGGWSATRRSRGDFPHCDAAAALSAPSGTDRPSSSVITRSASPARRFSVSDCSVAVTVAVLLSRRSGRPAMVRGVPARSLLCRPQRRFRRRGSRLLLRRRRLVEHRVVNDRRDRHFDPEQSAIG